MSLGFEDSFLNSLLSPKATIMDLENSHLSKYTIPTPTFFPSAAMSLINALKLVMLTAAFLYPLFTDKSVCSIIKEKDPDSTNFSGCVSYFGGNVSHLLGFLSYLLNPR